MKVWIVHTKTESGDSYYSAYSFKPKKYTITKELWEKEGKCADLRFYEETTDIHMEEVDINE